MDKGIWSWLKIGVIAVLVVADAVLLALVIGNDPVAGGAAATTVQKRQVTPEPSASHASLKQVVPESSASRSPQNQPVTATTLPGMVEDAVSTTTWPALDPPLQKLAGAEPASTTTCSHTGEASLKDCTFGPAHADHVAVVLGDDVAVSWLPGIRAALEPRGWQVQALTYQGCPASTIWVMAAGAKPDSEGDALTHSCADHQQWAQTRIESIKPDLVIFASGENTLDRLATGAHGVDAQHLWQIAVTDSVNRLREDVGRTVVLGPPPEGTDIRRCDTAQSPSECTFTISATWQRMSSADRAAASATGAAYVDTSRWFCDEAGRCPAFVDGTIVRADGVHLTADYSRRLAPLLAGTLLGSQG